MKYSSITTMELPDNMPGVSVEVIDLTTSMEDVIGELLGEMKARALIFYILLSDGLPDVNRMARRARMARLARMA